MGRTGLDDDLLNWLVGEEPSISCCELRFVSVRDDGIG